VALLQKFHRDLWQRLMGWGNRILIVGLLATAALFYGGIHHYYIDGYGYGYFMSGFGYSLLAMCFALLVIAALSPHSWLHRLRIPGAAALAAWSYAIYLTHKPLAVIVQKLSPAEISASLLLAAITGACLAGGWLLYRLVETPFMRWRSRRFPSNFPAATARPPAALAQTAA